MVNINFTSAFLQRPESGPAYVELTGEHANGETYCFGIHLPSGSAEDWLKKLGFTEWTERAQGVHVRKASGREVAGPVDTLVTESGAKRQVLTTMAKGFVPPQEG